MKHTELTYMLMQQIFQTRTSFRLHLKKYKTTLFFLLLSVLPALQTGAQEMQRLTVDELFQLGMENSLKVKASEMNVSVATAREQAARSRYLPDITMGATGGYLGRPTVYARGLTQPGHPPMPDWSQNYNIELVQPLFRGGKIKYAAERASLEREMAALGTDRDKADVKLLLMSHYLDLFELYMQQKVYTQHIRESELRLHDIRGMMEQGMITRNDVIRSELQLTNYQLSLNECRNNILIVSRQLDVVLGLDEELLLEPDTTLLDQVCQTQTFPEYVSEAYASFPDLKIRQSQTALARTDLQLTRADYFPTLSFRAANTLARPLTNVSPAQDLFMNNWNVALVLSYNLSSLYHNQHTMNAARRMTALRRNEEEQLRQDIRINIQSALIKHNEAKDRVKALSLSVVQAEENLRIVRNKYMNHLAILTDLLDADAVRMEAELQLMAARTTVIYTYYQLLRTSGNL